MDDWSRIRFKKIIKYTKNIDNSRNAYEISKINKLNVIS